MIWSWDSQLVTSAVSQFPNLGFSGDSVVKNPPAKQEMQVQSQGREDPLEKGMGTHSSIQTKEHQPQTRLFFWEDSHKIFGEQMGNSDMYKRICVCETECPSLY